MSIPSPPWRSLFFSGHDIGPLAAETRAAHGLAETDRLSKEDWCAAFAAIAVGIPEYGYPYRKLCLSSRLNFVPVEVLRTTSGQAEDD